MSGLSDDLLAAIREARASLPPDANPGLFDAYLVGGLVYLLGDGRPAKGAPTLRAVTEAAAAAVAQTAREAARRRAPDLR